MTGLAAMIAKQKAQAAAKENVSGGTEQASSESIGAVAPAVGGDAVPATPVVAGAKLNFGVKKPTQLVKQPPVPPVKPASIPDAEVLSTGTDLVVQNGVMTLDDLSDSTDEGRTPRSEFAFDDEIPATAPERDLEGLDAAQREFVTTVNGIYEIMHDPELFGGMIRTIMQELQENPAHMSLMADQDVHVMIRGLRSSMGLAKIKKAEKSVKGRAAKKAPPVTAIASTLEGMFNADEW